MTNALSENTSNGRGRRGNLSPTLKNFKPSSGQSHRQRPPKAHISIKKITTESEIAAPILSLVPSKHQCLKAERDSISGRDGHSNSPRHRNKSTSPLQQASGSNPCPTGPSETNNGASICMNSTESVDVIILKPTKQSTESTIDPTLITTQTRQAALQTVSSSVIPVVTQLALIPDEKSEEKNISSPILVSVQCFHPTKIALQNP